MGKSLKEAALAAKADAPQPIGVGTPKVEAPKAATPVIEKAKGGAVTVTATYAGDSKGGKGRFEYQGAEGKVFLYLERSSKAPVTVTIS